MDDYDNFDDVEVQEIEGPDQRDLRKHDASYASIMRPPVPADHNETKPLSTVSSSLLSL